MCNQYVKNSCNIKLLSFDRVIQLCPLDIHVWFFLHCFLECFLTIFVRAGAGVRCWGERARTCKSISLQSEVSKWISYMVFNSFPAQDSRDLNILWWQSSTKQKLPWYCSLVVAFGQNSFRDTSEMSKASVYIANIEIFRLNLTCVLCGGMMENNIVILNSLQTAYWWSWWWSYLCRGCCHRKEEGGSTGVC